MPEARRFLFVGAVVLAALLPASSAFAATTVTIEGPLGTTVTTPPLQLGPPGQPGPLDPTKVGVAGLSVSANAAPGTGSPSSPSSPASPSAPTSPTQQTPQQTPTQQAPQGSSAQVSPSSPSTGTQPSGAAGGGRTQPTRREETRTQSRNGSASTPSGSQRSGSAEDTSRTTGSSAAESRAKSAVDEPTPEQRRRPSTAKRIVDRVPIGYRLGLLAVAALAGGFALATLRQRRRARRAEAEALVDPLTGLANRRAFDRRLAEEWKRSERYGRPLGLVMLDLDGFKQVNDTRGHKEGDRVLRQAASLIADRLRAIDLVARLGGDEFAALCPETSSEGLDALTHSLEQCLQGLPVGASIGFAAREPEDENPLDLLARADTAMYRHKNGGEAARPVAAGLTR